MLRNLIKISKWLNRLQKTIISVFRILLLSQKNPLFRKQKTNKKRVVVLGNGPSFRKSIDDNIDFIRNNELICLNHFAITDYYVELKPSYYFAIAHDLFLDNTDVKYIHASNKLFNAIVEKTTWKLKFFITNEARSQKRWQNILRQNSNIEIIYMNLTPVEGFDRFMFKRFAKAKGMPRPHNVMVPAIFSAINIGFKEIILLGADHSWIKELFVDQNNKVLFFDKHFYDKERKLKKFNFDENNYPKLHQILDSLSRAFESYHTLNEYANYRKVTIKNCTPDSFIDAFVRDEISNVS